MLQFDIFTARMFMLLLFFPCIMSPIYVTNRHVRKKIVRYVSTRFDLYLSIMVIIYIRLSFRAPVWFLRVIILIILYNNHIIYKIYDSSN